ncbi:hypothetical protein B0J14DRAFT_604130 [Halenospora varia]|nr:hypothetical protein B0J14DRAFT_604130 [Halenospora varia]
MIHARLGTLLERGSRTDLKEVHKTTTLRQSLIILNFDLYNPIMTGGGLYAVNKLSKTALDHRSSSSQYPPQGPPPQNQNQQYWGPPPPPPRGPQQNAYYGDYSSQQQQNGWYPPQQGYQPRGYAEDQQYMNDERKMGYQDGNGQNGYSTPPPYAQQQQQGYYETPQRGMGGRSEQVAGLAGMAMDFVGSQGKGGGKKGKKGSEMIGEFLGGRN